MIPFSKMHGCGNDFVLVDGRNRDFDWPSLAVDMCDRHFGVGADGVLVAAPSDVAAIRMRMFNPDGSEAEMCGNGIRCFAKYVVECGVMPPESFRVETGAGALTVEPFMEAGRVTGARIGMGQPVVAPELVPVNLDGGNGAAAPAGGPVLNYPVAVNGRTLPMTFVSLGNPHAVTFLDEPVEDFPLAEIGPQVERHPLFPKRTNFEIVSVVDPSRIKVRVWERGAGLTLACGTGACAAAAAARLQGLTGNVAQVELPGGALNIEWDGRGEMFMSGPAEEVFRGEWTR